MTILKKIINEWKAYKEHNPSCKCNKIDKCTCLCHKNPGVMHIINCCTIKKCDTCQKSYNAKR